MSRFRRKFNDNNKPAPKELHPVFEAIQKNDMEAFKRFVAAHDGLHERDQLEHTPLSWAVLMQRPEMVRMLISARVDVNTVTNYGDAPLHIAAMTGNQEIIKMLLKAHADVNVRNRTFATPLILAINGNHRDAALILLDKGAQWRLADGSGRNAFQHATEKKDTVLINAMAEVMRIEALWAAKKKKWGWGGRK